MKLSEPSLISKRLKQIWCYNFRMRHHLPTALKMLIEMCFIIFLFYSNLLMGEYTRSRFGQERGLLWALGDVFTKNTILIALIAAFIGYIVFEFLRKLI